MASMYKTNFEMGAGVPDQKRDEVREKLQKILLEPKRADIERHLVKTTPVDRKIIGSVEMAVDELVAGYGGDPKPFPVGKICLVKPGAIAAITRGRYGGGMLETLGQRIIVERGVSDLYFALILTHEMLHLKSYKEVGVMSNDEVVLQRAGLSVSDHQNRVGYFSRLEEAIVAESSRRIFQTKLKTYLRYREEVRRTEKAKKMIERLLASAGMDESDRQAYLDEIYVIPEADAVSRELEYESRTKSPHYLMGWVEGVLQKSEHEGHLVFTERIKERKALYEILDQIVQKSGGRFGGRQEVFDEFARANFSGNLRPLETLVESTLGAGAFRKIAEMTSIKYRC